MVFLNSGILGSLNNHGSAQGCESLGNLDLEPPTATDLKIGSGEPFTGLTSVLCDLLVGFVGILNQALSGEGFLNFGFEVD